MALAFPCRVRTQIGLVPAHAPDQRTKWVTFCALSCLDCDCVPGAYRYVQSMRHPTCLAFESFTLSPGRTLPITPAWVMRRWTAFARVYRHIERSTTTHEVCSFLPMETALHALDDKRENAPASQRCSNGQLTLDQEGCGVSDPRPARGEQRRSSSDTARHSAALAPRTSVAEREHGRVQQPLDRHVTTVGPCFRRRIGVGPSAVSILRDGRELVGELGIEAGLILQDLERAILRHDPQLHATHISASRSILVALRDRPRLDSLLALAEQLARKPRKQIVIAWPLESAVDLSGCSRLLNGRRERLQAAGLSARVAAFVSGSPGEDLVRLAVAQQADLVLIDGSAELLRDRELHEAARTGTVRRTWPVRDGGKSRPCARSLRRCRASLGGGRAGRVDRRFDGCPSGARRNRGRPLERTTGLEPPAGERLTRNPAGSRHCGRTAPGRGGRRRARPGGCSGGSHSGRASDRWSTDGLGTVRHALVTSGGPPTVLVRRGARPGGLAPDEELSRFTWSLVPSVAQARG